MTNQEILTKAIEKAIAGGWKRERYTTYAPDKMAEYLIDKGTWPVIIYSKNFAKSLWGEEEQDWDGEGYVTPDWQYHLQQMVIAENPIKYLGENLG